MRIVNIQNPQAPVLVSSTGTSINTSQIGIRGSHAYVAAFSNVRIYDVSNPSSPIFQGTIPANASARGITIEGNLGYISDSLAGITIVDVSNPPSAPMVGSEDTPGVANRVIVADGLAYIADGPQGLQIIDVTNPSSPELVGSCDTPGDARDLAVLGTTVFIEDGGQHVQVIDASNPSSPALIGAHEFSEEIHTLYADPPFLYVNGAPDLMVFDASDPLQLHWIGGYQSITTDIAIVDDLLVTTGDSFTLRTAPKHCSAATGVSEVFESAGSLFVFPNPMTRGGSNLLFTAHRCAGLQLSIYDVAGRRIRLLAEGPHEGGMRAHHWDGQDDMGAPVAPGVYFAKLAVDAATQDVQKIVLVR
jgi:hypothetical protein